MRVRQLAQRGQQVLDALSGRDAADVQEHRRVVRDAEIAREAPSARARQRLREAVPAHVDALARDDADATTSSRSMLEDDDDGGRTRRDAAVERRVERSLQRHLAQPRPEHPQRLEHVRDPLQARPRRPWPSSPGRGSRRRARRRAARPVELERQRRRDPHPAVVRGGREVVDAHAVAFLRPRVPGAGPVDRGQASSSRPRPDGRAQRGASSARAPRRRRRRTPSPATTRVRRRGCAAGPPRPDVSLGAVAAQPNKPRLLVLNQYYWPGVEATAQLLTDLCEALADEYEIRVLTVSCTVTTHEPRARSCATASRSCASARRRSSARGSASAGSTTSPTSASALVELCAGRARPRAVHDRPADGRRRRRSPSRGASACRCS